MLDAKERTRMQVCCLVSSQGIWWTTVSYRMLDYVELWPDPEGLFMANSYLPEQAWNKMGPTT